MDICCTNSNTSDNHQILELGCKEKATAECFDSHQKKGSDMIDKGASARRCMPRNGSENGKKNAINKEQEVAFPTRWGKWFTIQTWMSQSGNRIRSSESIISAFISHTCEKDWLTATQTVRSLWLQGGERRSERPCTDAVRMIPQRWVSEFVFVCIFAVNTHSRTIFSPNT